MEVLNREELYTRDFILMSLELYNVIYQNHDTQKLDIMLRRMRELYSPIKRDTACLEYPPCEIFRPKYFTEDEKNLLKKMFQEKDSSKYFTTDFRYRLSMIYKMERTYTLPSFVNG